MAEHQKILNYVNFGFTPFSKRQCIGRIILLWILCGIVYLISKRNLFWIISLGMIVLTETAFFLSLILKKSSGKTARFLSDGVFMCTVAVLLVFASYLISTTNTTDHWLLLIILFSLLLVWMIFVLLLVRRNIKADKYNGEQNNTVSIWPFVFGAFGILAARILLQGQSEDTALTIVAVLLMLLSCIFSIGIHFLLKAILIKRYGLDDSPNE